MDSVKKGIFFIIFSSFIFGATPILTRAAYDEGANSVTVTFLRSVLAAPFLFAVMRYRKIPFVSSLREAAHLLFGGVTFSVTLILMYSSYAYIPVGEAVTLHFAYPALVSLGCVLFFREKPTKPILAALVLSAAGVALFSEDFSFSFANMFSGASAGFLLALGSGATFAVYMIHVDKSSLRNVEGVKISFSLCVVGMFCAGLYGRFTDGLSLGLTPKGWLYVWIVALSVSFLAMWLLQEGIKCTGATAAAILSTFEPITSVLCGALFLGEQLSPQKITGCACIIVSVILVTLAGTGEKKLNKETLNRE